MGITVVVAEDYAALRSVTAHIIRETRVVEHVIEAGDGRVALDELLVREPEIMLIDMQMPFLAGYEVVRAYRNKKPEGKTEFVMMSCFPEQYEAVAAGLGAHFLRKPYDINTLREKIKRIADRISRTGKQDL